MALTQVNGGMLDSVAQQVGFRNRIINGAMMVNQRAASVTSTGYVTDRFQYQSSQASKGTAQQSATAPAGFINSLQFTSSSAYSVLSTDYFALQQVIEGLNISDFGWGTANAQTVTLSFKVYSSLTGTFGGSLINGGNNRSYPFSYTVSTANTWTTISITIAGDTTGTWATDNGAGVKVWFSLGAGSTYSGTSGAWASGLYMQPTGATSVVGTNGATFYITGVQLEKGSTATSFDYRPYGTELALCQRYYEKSYDINVAPGTSTGAGFYHLGSTDVAANSGPYIQFKATKRASPTFTAYLVGGTAGSWQIYNAGGTATAAPTSLLTTQGGLVYCGGFGTTWAAAGVYGNWTASAEL